MDYLDEKPPIYETTTQLKCASYLKYHLIYI
jgi:hypothetical protein